MKKTLLQRTIKTQIDLYGGLRKAARKLKVAASTLVRINNGELRYPTDETLDKFGLERVPGLEIHRSKK